MHTDISADYGESWAVRVTYRTDAAGRIIGADETTPETIHGPWSSREAAEDWADARAALGDPDVVDVVVIPINNVR